MSNQSMAAQLEAVAPFVPKAEERIDHEPIPAKVIEYQDAAVKSVQNGSYRVNAPQPRVANGKKMQQQGKIRAPQLGGVGKQNAKPGVVNVQVLKPKPQIRQPSLTLGGLTWEDKKEEIVLVIKDSPFGELVIKLESAQKWDGPFVCILKKVPSNLGRLTQAQIPGAPEWQSRDLPQVFVLEETPWGRMAFSVTKTKDSDTPFVRVLK